MRIQLAAMERRRGAAAVEFAVCLPLMLLILTGLWEVGRITEVQQVIWNAAREAARDASLGQDNLQTVATNLLTYLQGAEHDGLRHGPLDPHDRPGGHLAGEHDGYTCWDNTANRELFTMTFTDLTNTTRHRPDGDEPARPVPDRRSGSLQQHRA